MLYWRINKRKKRKKRRRNHHLTLSNANCEEQTDRKKEHKIDNWELRRGRPSAIYPMIHPPPMED
jgi:hypothetical protein